MLLSIYRKDVSCADVTVWDLHHFGCVQVNFPLVSTYARHVNGVHEWIARGKFSLHNILDGCNNFMLKDRCVMVFLSFLSSPYGLTISLSTYGYNVTWSPM